ncbi:MAG: hypothetical protein QNJ30_20355 [Kiloniellales bacterium]|nr:hypothetical protein [Kiloniellales bacterium]
MTTSNRWLYVVLLLIPVHLALIVAAKAETVAVEASVLEQLQQIIKQQQEELQTLRGRVEDLERKSTETETIATEAKTTAAKAIDTAERTSAGQLPDKVVTSGQERIKLAISGQVNRATNIANDGEDTDAYFVDNDASNTRFRFVGTGKVTDDFTIGSRIEIALTANESSDVSQDNEAADDFVDARWAEVSFDSKRFGKLSIGQGDTASNNTSEVDLSKTDVVQYASIADIAGGLQFRDTDDNLTGVTVSDGFNDVDGLSRQSRARYDTPSFYGFRLAGSAVSDDRWDAAVTWGGQGYGFKAGAAAAVAEPNRDNEDLQYNGSFSILHEDTGLNFTFSGGMRDRDNGGDGTNLWGKIGWIADFFSFGTTAFGVDYDRSVNFPSSSDDGYSVGLAAVQSLEQFGTEIFLQYRLYSLDRSGPGNFEDINVGTIGARVKF